MGIEGIRGSGTQGATFEEGASAVSLDASTAVAMVALELGQLEKDSQSGMRDAAYAEEDRRADERIRMMSEKAVFSLVSGVASGALSMASGALKLDLAAHPKDVDAKTALTVLDATTGSIDRSLKASEGLFDVEIAKAEKTEKQFDRMAKESDDAVKAGQQLVDRAIQSAGNVQEATDQTLLITAKMA